MNMNGTTSLITGVGLGVAAMYLLDPEKGRSRRAHLTQKIGRLGHLKSRAWEASLDDAKNRLVGMWRETASKFAKDDVSDEALSARVRAAMGRVVSHPGAVEVACENGEVRLSGDILAKEVEGLLACTQKVRGVKGVANELTMHDAPGSIPNLQGEGKPSRANTLQMPPGPAMAAGLAGLGLMVYGMTRRDGVGKVMEAAGAALAAKGMWDVEGDQIKNLVGLTP